MPFSSLITPAIPAWAVYTYILASRLVITPSHLSREQSRCGHPPPTSYAHSKSAEHCHSTQQQITQPAGLLDHQRSFAAGALPAPAAHLSGWTLRLRPTALRAFPVYLAHSHTQCTLLFSQIFNHILIHTARQIFDPLPGAKKHHLRIKLSIAIQAARGPHFIRWLRKREPAENR